MERARYFWLITLVTAALVALCAVTAISLFREQARIARVLRENVASRKAAVELEECLAGLIAQEVDKVETVSALHARVGAHLKELSSFADEQEEQNLYVNLNAAFDEYLKKWSAIPQKRDSEHEAAVHDATDFLQTNVLKMSQEFRLHQGRQLEDSTLHHERVLLQLGSGMALVGGLGGVAGMVLGFGVARGLSRSIRRLQVQISDAAGKLGPAIPQIVVTREGDFRGLHEQVDELTSRIESVVQELQEREREVLRAEQLSAVGQLAAGVAHEVRNPLTSIKMLVQLGLEEGVSIPRDDLRVIESEVRKMEQSLQTFLDFARPPKPARQPTNLQEIVTKVLGLTRGRAEKQHVTVRVYSPPDPIILTADPGQLQQVLVNLVLNALDAMPTGGIIHLIVRPGAGRVEIEVADTGPGIPLDLLPKLFSPFVSTKDTGMGLGLVISRRIAEDHGGTLTAANRPGGGSAFTFSLPRDSGS